MFQSLALLRMPPPPMVPPSSSPRGVDILNLDIGLMRLSDNSNTDCFCGSIGSRSRSKSRSRSTSRSRISNDRDIQTFTLYLIRHGEASHNVKEKAAKQRAKEEAVREGYESDSEEVQERMEEARKAVLNDNTLFDAPLSDLGREEAKSAAHHLQQILANNNHLPSPSEILVSPLQRTLQTADLIFPDHTNIRVREEIRERCTGKPPDTHAPFRLLRRRNTFERFSMAQLRELEEMEGMEYQDAYARCLSFHESSSEDDNNNKEGGGTGNTDKRNNVNMCNDKKQKKKRKEENRAMLRIRTKKLIDLLAQSEHRSIAVVTHKGYLRELERGPFEQTNAIEFKNCEVRVYRVSVHVDDDDSCLENATRIL